MENVDSNPDASKPPKKACLNCGKKMPRKALYCPACGQRDSDGKVRIRELLWKLWVTTFHLDNKLFRTLRDLFIPGRIAAEYFRGRMKRYLHPVQLYLVTMVFALFTYSHWAISSHHADPEGMGFDRGKLAMLETIRSDFNTMPDSLRLPAYEALLDSIQLGDLPNNSLPTQQDSILIPEPILGNKRISMRDYTLLPVDSIGVKYATGHWFKDYFLKQAIKSRRSGSGMGKFFLGSLTWTFLILIAAVSAMVYWFFHKKGRFYVEHVVLMLYMHAAFFITGGLWALFEKYGYTFPYFGAVIMGSLTLYSFFTVYFFYRLSIWQTAWRWVLATVLYILLLGLLVITGYTVCVLLF